MKNPNSKNNQNGFVGIVVLVLLLLVATAGVFVFNRSRDSQNSKAIFEDTKQNNQKAAAAQEVLAQKKLNEKAATPPVEPSPPPTPPTQEPAPAQQPSPDPTPPVSNATKFTAANCNGVSTVYVSNQNGAEASYRPPESWQVHKTYGYGESFQVYCIIGGTAFAPDYVLENDAYIKTSDLSPTKP